MRFHALDALLRNCRHSYGEQRAELVSGNARRSSCNGLPHPSSDDHNSGRTNLTGPLARINATRAFG